MEPARIQPRPRATRGGIAAADTAPRSLVTEHSQQSVQSVKLLSGPHGELILRQQAQLTRRHPEDPDEVLAKAGFGPPLAGLPAANGVRGQPGVGLTGLAHVALDLGAQLVVAPATFESLPREVPIWRVPPRCIHRASLRPGSEDESAPAYVLSAA